MGRTRGASPRAVVAGTVVALQVLVCVALALMPLDDDPHHAPVSFAGPPIVADALADQAGTLRGEPLAARAVASPERARSDVEHGRAVAAVVVDVRLGTATVLVSEAQGDVLTTAVTALARTMAEPFAADVIVKDVAPVPSGSAGQRGLRLIAAGAVVVGLGIAVGVTWSRGPVADTWPEAWRRVGIAVGVTVVASLVVATIAAHAVGGSLLAWWVVVSLTVLATGSATLALEAVVGVAGIGVAVTVFVVSAAPLIRAEHPLLLPDPWGLVTPWLPHGAAIDAGRQVAFLDVSDAARPVVVLLSWTMVSCVLLAVARRERRRAGVAPDLTV